MNFIFHLQFLSDTLEAIFKTFKFLDLVKAEYKRRALNQRVNVCVCSGQNAESKERALSQRDGNRVSRSTSIFRVLVDHGRSDAFKIEKYNDAFNFDKPVEIKHENGALFGLVMQKNRIFILGGFNRHYHSKSVSLMANSTKGIVICEDLIFLFVSIACRCPRTI